MMPRAKPTQVIEHRLSLSDYERSALKDFLLERQRIERLNAASKGVASVGAVASSGVALWLVAGYLALDIVPDIVDKAITTVTVMQKRCPEAIKAADDKIARYESQIQYAIDQNAPARFVKAEQEKLNTLKERRNRLADLCEWATIGQEYNRLETDTPSFLEIWQKVFTSGL